MPFDVNDFVTAWTANTTNVTNQNNDYTTTNYWTPLPEIDWTLNANTGTLAHNADTTENHVTFEDLDKFFHRVYKIIEEHTKIDINEDEFIKLLNEGE